MPVDECAIMDFTGFFRDPVNKRHCKLNIPTPFWLRQGIITDFGTLLLKRRRVPCQWKKVRDITAVRTERSPGAETVLVDDDQHIYIPIFDRAPAAPNCPTSYWWTETRDPKIRVAQKVVMDSEVDRQFPELPADEVLPAASMEPQLDYAFHNLGKTVKARMSDQKLGCLDIRTWEGKRGTGFSLRAKQVTLAGETTLYSLKCC